MFGKLMTNYVEDPIKHIIFDESRRELALKSLSGLKDDIEEFNSMNMEDIERFTNLIKNYESTREEFDHTFSVMLSNRQEIIIKIWADRSELLSNIQPEEWKAIIDSAKTAELKD
jgi:hypothetical protein